jgi:hypothetical protein
MIGNQPLGEQRGMGLNEAAVRATALADRIAQAVAAAAAAGNMSRKDVVAQFADQPKTVVYRHIAKAIEATGVKLEKTKLARRSPAMTEAEQEAELAAVMPAVEEIERLCAGGELPAPDPADPAPISNPPVAAPVVEETGAGDVVTAAEFVVEPFAPLVIDDLAPLVLEEIGPTSEDSEKAPPDNPPSRRNVEPARPASRELTINANGEAVIDLAAGMERALARAEKLMIKAEHEDGEVRNARLMVVAIDLFGKTAERKARMDADLSDASQQAAYLRALTNAVLAEPADVKARILARMRGVNAQWGM